MIGRSKQKGVVILLLVVMLPLLSVAVTGALPHVRAGHAASTSNPSHLLDQMLELREARQALISYSTLYPYLYGPGGAGPGHFPCPDTDGRQFMGDTIWAVNLGPNPPCGSQLKSIGRLPNHVSFSSHRYLIHSRLESDIDYQLSEGFVNNPINRIVNPTTIQTHSLKLDSPIRLHTSIQSPGDSSVGPVGTHISSAAMLASAKLSVGSWAVQRLVTLHGEKCIEQLFVNGINAVPDDRPLDGSLSDNKDDVANEQCQQLVRLKLVELVRKCGVQENSDSQRVLKLPAMVLLALLSDISLVESRDGSVDETMCDSQGDSIVNASNTMEAIPVRRHWFYRNGWADWIQFHLSNECMSVGSMACKLSHIKTASDKAESLDVLLSWNSLK